jgi:hypothetical protein
VSISQAAPGQRRPRCLLLGAGAVGVAYGHHLAQGGARVTFLVRPHHADRLAGGLVIHRLNARRTERFVAYDVLTDVEAVRPGDFDQVWLCVPSDALRAPMVEAVLARLGQATLVAFQPGPRDHAWLAERVPAAQRVQGLISLIAYPAPLPGEARSEGTAWWFPPLAPSPFSGAAAGPVVAALRRGGCPAKVAKGVAQKTAFGSSLMMPVIATLELSGWRFAALFAGERLTLGVAAAREANALAAPSGPRWLARLITARLTLRAVAALGRRVVPFDLETYLRVHFTKVGVQTAQMLGTYRAMAAEEGRAVPAIEALHVALETARA